MGDIKHEPMIETARRVIAEHRETLEALHKGETSGMPSWLLSIAVRAGCSAEEFDQLREYAKQAAELERERLYRLVADDAWAITFQTFGQYRTALLKAIRGTK